MGKKKTIPGGDRTMILRVIRYFEEEKRRQNYLFPVDEVLKRTCAATGVSISTVMRIKEEERLILEKTPALPANPARPSDFNSTLEVNVQLPTPGKRRSPSKKKILFDNSLISSLRKIIDNYETVKDKKPTLKTILALAKSHLDFKGERETLRVLLTTKMGYNLQRTAKRVKNKADDEVVYVKTEEEEEDSCFSSPEVEIKIERLD